MEDSLTSKISNWGTWVGSKGADVFTDWDFLGGHSTKFYEFVGAEANNFINFLLDARHLWALGWGVAMVIFGLFILAWDTRPSYTPRKFSVRDRILGLEQRYFVVVLNGVLLYATLYWSSSPKS